MKHTVTKGIASSYVITVHVEKNDRDDLHSKALQSLQSEVKVPGFRPGHVPLHMVEKQIKPEYLRMAFLEEILHKSLNDLMKDHDDKKFIGQPYDLKDEENGDTLVVTYKLDTYPEAEITNADWKKLTIAPVDTTVNEKEIEQAMSNLQRQYADYEDAETVNDKTLIKAKYTILDKDGTELHKGNAYLSDAEYQEFPNLLEAVNGKKK
ncbi:MAG: trigger factor family protein [bacterium]